jgi:hypothetical protein
MRHLTTATVLTACLLASTAPAGETKDPWKEFTWKEAGITVLLPGTPAAKTVDTKGDIKLQMQVVEAKDRSYKVSFAVVPLLGKADDAVRGQFFDAFKLGTAEAVMGKATGEKEIKYAGKYPGREWTFDAPGKGVCRVKAFVVEDRFYSITVLAPAGVANSKETDRYLDSVKLTK